MTQPSAAVMRQLPIVGAIRNELTTAKPSHLHLVGAKKGQSKSREPVEGPDTLRSRSFARVLDLISEGEIRGLVAGNQSIYLDQVPIQNADGTLNFQGVSVETRSELRNEDRVHAVRGRLRCRPARRRLSAHQVPGVSA